MKETRKQTEARRMKRQLQQTAAEKYADHQTDIGALLDLVGEEMRVHAEAAAKEPKDWGFAGTLGNVRNTLKQVLAGFLISRYEWTETEAARFIEDHLEEMRES
jgi:hypothetical protein